MSTTDASSSTSFTAIAASSHDKDAKENLDVFILASELMKTLARHTDSNAIHKKALSQLASFYNMKLVPMNSVSQGSNQILNHLSGSQSKKEVNNKSFAVTSQKGQPPPNPVKRDPEYIKMSKQHDDLIEKVKTLNKGTDEHHNVLKSIRAVEVAMANFKRQRGRNIVAPAETQGIPVSVENKTN